MDEDISHLDFVPDDPELKNVVEADRKALADPRDSNEALADEIDLRLTPMLHEVGALEADNSDTFRADTLITIARAAYFRALIDTLDKPEVLEKMLHAMGKEGPGLDALEPQLHKEE